VAGTRTSLARPSGSIARCSPVDAIHLYMYNTATVPKAIESDEESRSRQVQARFSRHYRPLTCAQYASHVVMFEDGFGSLRTANRKQILRYLKALSSKGVKQRAIQALRAYIAVLHRDGSRKSDPMEGISLRDVHRDPPSVGELREELSRGGIEREVVHRLTWRDLTLLSLRADPFMSASQPASRLATRYLDGRIGGRRVLRFLRARAHRPLSDR
jgi:hypothetical protein